MKDHVLSQGEIKTKQWKNIFQVLKSSSEPLGQFQTNSAQAQICLLFKNVSQVSYVAYGPLVI